MDVARDNLQSYLRQLETWLTSNRMSVSAQKSSITLVTPFNREYRLTPQVDLFGDPLPVEPYTKILGLTLDRGMTFRQHVQEVNARARSRLNAMKALASTTFGHSKESLTALYKQFVRPVMEYASSSWTPDLAQSHMEVLQRTQNAALRIATGCTRSTPTAHLHAETMVLPLRDHMDLRGTQLFTAAASPEHPLHDRLHNPIGTQRQIHTTPSAHYTALRTMIPPPPPQRSESSWLHESFVTRYLAAAPSNSVLGEAPPSLMPGELGLPRQDRVHLARLRCGHHPALLSYENRLRPDVDPTCRWCGTTGETVSHLLGDCAGVAGDRLAAGLSSARDLWARPVQALGFLRSIGLVPDPHLN